MRTTIPRASRSRMPRWPRSPSSVTCSTASGTTPSHPVCFHPEAVISRHALSTVDVAATVSEACELLERTLGSGYHIHREVALDLPRALGVGRAELEAVIVNLVVKARDAMPSGGAVTIAAASEDVSPENAEPVSELPPG